MTRIRSIRSAMAASAAVVVLAAACAGSSDAADTTEPPVVGSTSTDANVRLVDVPEAPSALRMRTGFGPVPFPASDGRTHLSYELYLTNRRADALTVTSVKVVDADEPSNVVHELSGDDLDDFMTSDIDKTVEGPAMEGGMSAIVYIDASVDGADDVPVTLAHILETTDDESGEANPAIEGAFTEPLDIEVPMLAPPVSDGQWVAAEGCCFKSHHRRPPLTLNGEDFLAQTYAIDFLKVVDGQLWEGDDPKDLDAWYTYGQDALAAVDGTVSSILTTEDDITPFEPNPKPRDIDNITGNHVIIDQGNGIFVVYAHLQPDSIVVEEGDEVKVGDKLALVGNSGNTDAPHLHIHVMDANHVVRSNPIPFGFESFELLGTYGDLETLLPEPFGEVGPKEPELASEPTEITNSYPLELDFLEFASS